MEENNNKKIDDLINQYKGNKNDGNSNKQYNNPQINDDVHKENDPDLIVTHELIDLPSKGLHYNNGLSQIAVEYMTAQDEDILTTPSLIENGEALNILLKRKIKTPNVNIDDLLPGDRNAIILFLRTSSYGSDYEVEVQDPRTGVPFQTTVNLLDLKYKKVNKQPDQNGHFDVYIPMRKKNVKFRLLTSGEDNNLFRLSEEQMKAYGKTYSDYNTLKLKTSIISIDGNSNRSYIDRFVNAMPALDSSTIKKEINKVSPDVDMSYEFTAKDGYKFKASLTIGLDFFFPNI